MKKLIILAAIAIAGSACGGSETKKSEIEAKPVNTVASQPSPTVANTITNASPASNTNTAAKPKKGDADDQNKASNSVRRDDDDDDRGKGDKDDR